MIANVPTSALSTGLVKFLREQGRTYRAIGEIVGLSESFVSRVARGERSFTLDHLAAFEHELGEPLPALVLQSQYDKGEFPPAQRAAYEQALQILRDLGSLRLEWKDDAPTTRRGRPTPTSSQKPKKASPTPAGRKTKSSPKSGRASG